MSFECVSYQFPRSCKSHEIPLPRPSYLVLSPLLTHQPISSPVCHIPAATHCQDASSALCVHSMRGSALLACLLCLCPHGLCHIGPAAAPCTLPLDAHALKLQKGAGFAKWLPGCPPSLFSGHYHLTILRPLWYVIPNFEVRFLFFFKFGVPEIDLTASRLDSGFLSLPYTLSPRVYKLSLTADIPL